MLDEIILPENKVIQVDATPMSAALAALSNLAGTRTVEIELPLLMTKAFVKPVTGSEELRLRTMKATGATFIESFNKVLYEHVTFDKLKFDNFEDFNSHLTPPDKALLVYALLDSTFKLLPEKLVTCPECGQVDNITVPPSDMLHNDTLNTKWTHKKDFTDYTIKSEVIPGFTVYYKMPNESDRIKLLRTKNNDKMRKELESTGDILNNIELFSAYVSKLEIVDGVKEDKKPVIVLTDLITEILPTLTGMPLELQSTILEDLSIKEFADFTPNFYLNIHCSSPTCSKPDFKWDNINPEQDFFLKALSVYN